MKMIKAFLLDMDNTLLVNPDRAFARAFLTQFDQHMLDTLQIDQVSTGFRQAIKQMSKSRTGTETNTALTRRLLSDHTQQDPALIQSALDSFYADSYPNLKHHIQPVDGAAELIHQLLDNDYLVVIATNPLYPHTAIKQRMQWANLPANSKHYNLVTSADNMHFAKPNPAYFAEILGYIGLKPDEAIVIGDSQRNDIAPAQTLGIHTYRIDENNTLQVFTNNWQDIISSLPSLQKQPAMVEPQLRGTIGALYGLLDTIHNDCYHIQPAPDALSIVDILKQLIARDENYYLPQLRRILQEENPTLTTMKPDEVASESYSDDATLLLRKFKEIRFKVITLVQSLSDVEWLRSARHNKRGTITLFSMTYQMIRQDRQALNQLQETIRHCKNSA